jgi:LmbE family N-acetylglucosaminyl deacetylase
MPVVSILAHPDDQMRCLGTMLECRAHLFFVSLTDGSGGFVQDPGIDPQRSASIRDGEMAALAADLQAGYLNLGEADEFLYDTPAIRLKLIEAIRWAGARLIFTRYAEDYNLDHVTISRLVRQCSMQACLPVLPTASQSLAAHPAVFMCEPFGAFSFPASCYVDIGALHAEKVRLLQHHASREWAMQAALGSGLEQLCARLATYRGELSGCQWAWVYPPGFYPHAGSWFDQAVPGPALGGWYAEYPCPYLGRPPAPRSGYRAGGRSLAWLPA